MEKMQTGYVLNINGIGGMFLVLDYANRDVRVAILDTDSVSPITACDMLSHKYSGTFKVADMDDRAWAWTLYRAKGMALSM